MTSPVVQRAWPIGRSVLGPAGESSPGNEDLPVTVDPRQTLPRASGLLLVATIPVVALTAASHMGPGYAFRDVIGLLTGYAVAMLLLIRVPWMRLPADWSWALVGVQVLFVVCLTTMTGGGASPFFALYAPILAIAGWHLRWPSFALLVGTVVILEGWRAIVVDGAGSLDQLTISLPFYAAVGFLALLAAQRLSNALVRIRQDQRRTAEVLAAVHQFGSDRNSDPLVELAESAQRVFGGSARSVAIEPPVASRDRVEPWRASADLAIPIVGQDLTYGFLTLERKAPLSSNERRQALILADITGRAIDARRRVAGAPAGDVADPIDVVGRE